MARFSRVKKEHIGMSPNALVFRGTQKVEKSEIRIIDYDKSMNVDMATTGTDEIAQYKSSPTTTWINVNGVHDSKLLSEIGEAFELEPVILSNIMDTHARPKIIAYDNAVYISLKMMRYDEEEEMVHAENLVLVVLEKVCLSFQEKTGDVFDVVRERISRDSTKIRKSGTDYLAYALVDVVFDNYAYILSMVGEQIEALEERIIEEDEEDVLEQINSFKRELLYFNKSVKPCKDLVNNWMKLDSGLMTKKIELQLKDLQDNIHTTIESHDSYREILSDQLNTHNTNMSNKLNDIMKFLTVFSVIFIPLTFIAGIYGTNFEYIPETGYKYAYFIMWGVMVVVALFMIYIFRKRKWL